MSGITLEYDLTFLDRTWSEFRPRPQMRLLDWAQQRIRTDKGSPYDHTLYPHIGAPGGPMDHWDADWIRTISLCWGVRLGKTFFGNCALTKAQETDPGPAMYATSREKLARESIERYYRMIDSSDALQGLLPLPEHLRSRDKVAYRSGEMFVAWSKSPSTLADKNIRYGQANEVDKWEHSSASTEGHPYDLFLDRFNDYYVLRKIITESTPSKAGSSVIWRLLLAGSFCRYYVPCPHCRGYQYLEFGDPDSKHGIKWEHRADGRSDPALAKQTAVYYCLRCEQPIRSEDRLWMMRRGVWCPEGCEVDDAAALDISLREQRPFWGGWKQSAWVRGTPARDTADASFHLPTLVALAIPDWGDFAERFCKVVRRPAALRVFVNQWLAKAWEPRPSVTNEQTLARRIGTELPAGVVPEWGRMLVVSVDRQASDGGFVVYVVIAFGPESRASVIQHGMARSLEELWEPVFRGSFPHADGGRPLTPVYGTVDSGWDARKTYEFCAGHENVIPLKGLNGLELPGFRIVHLGEDGSRTSTEYEGLPLFQVSVDLWEEELQERLEARLADEPNSLSLARDVAFDQEFLSQLLNGTLADKTDARGNARQLWVKKDESLPNDFRDAVRNGLALAECCRVELGDLPDRSPGPRNSLAPVINPGDRRPDGREWIQPAYRNGMTGQSSPSSPRP